METKSGAEFRVLAEQRLLDAKSLFASGRFDGAYYMAGYAVECALKACICKRVKADTFPPKDGKEFWVHDPTKLLKLADLDGELAMVERQISESWGTVKEWSEVSRYDSFENAEKATREMIAAIEGVLQWLRNTGRNRG